MDDFTQKVNQIIDDKMAAMTNMAIPNVNQNSWDANQLDPAVSLLGFPVIQVVDASANPILLNPNDKPQNGTFRFYVDPTPHYTLWSYLTYQNTSGALVGAWEQLGSSSVTTGTVTSITAGTGLSGGTITTSGTIAIANTTVTPASYTNANITVNQQGQITAASNGSGGTGTVTSVSVVTANGFAGTVAASTTTPAITISTIVSGVLKGNGTTISTAINSDLPAMSSTVGGAVPTPPNNTTTFLRGDGTFAIPSTTSSAPYTVNADETYGVSYSSIINPPSSATVLNGWSTFTGFTSTSSGIIYKATTSSTVATCGVISRNNISNLTFLLNTSSTNTIRLKVAGALFSSQAGDYGAFGFTDGGSATNFADRTNTVGLDVKFIYNLLSNSIWCVTSNGGVTATAVSSPPPFGSNQINIFDIVIIPGTSATFYINGTVVATNTTNMYGASATPLFFGVGALASNGSSSIAMGLMSPTFNVTI